MFTTLKKEVFTNGGWTCVVLARSGDTALIVLLGNEAVQFVVPAQHRQGQTDWWHGHYFEDIDKAYEFYKERIKEAI